MWTKVYSRYTPTIETPGLKWSDIMTINLSDEDVDDYNEDAIFMYQNRGQKTNSSIIANDETSVEWKGKQYPVFKHDQRGFGAHLGVEKYFAFRGYTFESLRKRREKLGTGDFGDIKYNINPATMEYRDIIDVKGSVWAEDWRRLDMHRCYVTKKQWEMMAKSGKVNRFIFATLWVEKQSVKIFGTIGMDAFDELKQPGTLPKGGDIYFITANDLDPIQRYVCGC